ncbi:MAG: FAD-dependent oxidoreductase [Corallococcus sp.]|nr:FAD-dependent oxidoreductase [Corallococcus sp.]MCM1359867.1 FAD-dependent oxidoreductase [Corallococcus sp.]MCM1395301.1 FAD-dependent oxidoreductase [Corallococcus sp.]
MKKIAIVGGGVAGLTAAVYALRANAEVTLFEQYGLGGLTATIAEVQNYPSYKSVEGWQLASDMAEQAKSLGLKTVRSRVLSLTKNVDTFTIATEKGSFDFPAVVVATGTAHNKLGFEAPYVGKGVSYCATCDGNFYKNLPVAVVGGGIAAVREATYLADICSKVYVIVPQSQFSTEDRAADDLMKKSNVTVTFNSRVSAITCAETVSAIDVFDGEKTYTLSVNCVFVAIGAAPVTEFIDMNDLDKQNGYLLVDGKCQTSVEGLFAAGDVTFGTLKQIVTACADGAKAGTFASAYAAKFAK